MRNKYSLTYLFIFTFLSCKVLIAVCGDENNSEESSNERSSEEVYQFETDDDIEEVYAEDDQLQNSMDGSSFSEKAVGEKDVDPPAQAIEINIQPVSSDEFSCKGVPNGNQVDPNPANCLSFYTCVEEVTYKIMCPQIPFKSFYDPVQKTCGDVSDTLCLEFAGQFGSKKESDLTADEEQDQIDYNKFGGEILDEPIQQTQQRAEL